MIRRWLIRCLCLLPLTLCAAGWAWSITHYGWVSYCGTNRWMQAGTDGGVVTVGSGQDTGWRGRGLSAITGANPRRFWPLPAWRGFDFLRSGDGVFLVVPYWLLLLLSALVLGLGWRGTRPRQLGPGFPVELASRKEASGNATIDPNLPKGPTMRFVALLLLLAVVLTGSPTPAQQSPTAAQPPTQATTAPDITNWRDLWWQEPPATAPGIRDQFKADLAADLIVKDQFPLRSGATEIRYIDGKGRVRAREEIARDKTLLLRQLFDEAGRMEGPRREWHKNGLLARVDQYHLGEKVGRAQEWDDAGNLVADYTLEHGTGVRIVRFPDSGRIRIYEPYVKHFRDGVYAEFYDSGRPEVVIRYQAGKIVGYSKDYHPNGKVRCFGTFSQGRLHGVGVYLDEKGQLARHERVSFWLNGFEVKPAEYKAAALADKSLPAYEENLDQYRFLPDKYPDIEPQIPAGSQPAVKGSP